MKIYKYDYVRIHTTQPTRRWRHYPLCCEMVKSKIISINMLPYAGIVRVK